jgi:integrase
VSLLDEAGLRIGEALGLRHEDLSLRRAEVRVVPREDNDNHARVKRMRERTLPVRDVVLDLYADYMELEYGMLDCDYVLVTLSGRTRGAPMTLHGAGKLFSRLRQRTGIGTFTSPSPARSPGSSSVRAAYPESPWLFPARQANLDGRRHTSDGRFREELTAWLERVELADEHGTPVRITSHQFTRWPPG